jgi:hypothetical protein
MAPVLVVRNIWGRISEFAYGNCQNLQVEIDFAVKGLSPAH